MNTRTAHARDRRISRSRWAAFGAAVAVTSGLAGVARITFAAGENAATYVAITPCRLLDTRTGTDNVGPRSSPLNADETYTAAVHGTNGNCTIPTEAVGVVLNVTIDNPTSASYLTVFPADKPLPLSSNLNWIQNQPPTPNAVTATLSATGAVSFYNHTGMVDVLADVMGYYQGGGVIPTDHNHDDRYFTEGEVLGIVGAAKSVSAYADGSQVVPVGFLNPVVVRTVTINPPSTGNVIVNFSAKVAEDTVGDLIRCSITQGNVVDQAHDSAWVYGGPPATLGSIAGTRGFTAFVGEPFIVKLVCQHFGSNGTTDVHDSSLTATFTPHP